MILKNELKTRVFSYDRNGHVQHQIFSQVQQLREISSQHFISMTKKLTLWVLVYISNVRDLGEKKRLKVPKTNINTKVLKGGFNFSIIEVLVIKYKY